MSYNPAFSKVLYVVPTVNAEGDTDNSAAVSDAILAGGSIFSSGTTLQNDAGGVSSTLTFIPVNAPEEGPGGGGSITAPLMKTLLNSVFRHGVLLALVLLPLVLSVKMIPTLLPLVLMVLPSST